MRQQYRKRGAITMKTSMRGSKSTEEGDFCKYFTPPASSVDRPLSLSYNSGDRPDLTRYSVRKGSTRNFMQKNRQAVSRNHGVTNNLSSCGNYPLNTFGGGTAPPRTKIGQVPKIGDALGTPSNKGSSSFMSAGHNGVRDATLKSGYMKRGF
ncbi:uncharacterized protein [Physcomitrium patens]|uniref:Uncharacterized protein n=1 Tax=Physcomitrium patens TaxID=3218 RepID=A0A2K1JYE7_PHYPA|nr:uncharacterized protein LOC112287465 [Physcomitrium patens]XP_024386242.1 uncharacterized protein LOC112287465 [Physcomitrium patens]PNR46554.1 hypothetical protein PHYPA_013673 [Physcomitrium patens]|eukprot:XP_024386241.1 uncharacterized protein LOC112287465 [Physcomitrella patens]